ncbi:MAG: acetoacetate decarboxylase family protein [Armatimonadota bacterium]|nr:acetoacetate decarboxylase family protein [bacterium]
MAYPPFPWKLQIQGVMLQTLQLVDVERVRGTVPSGIRIVPVISGRTVGGIYFATYGPGSDLEYHELGVFSALVRYGRQYGMWVSNMYVDNPDSVAAARECMGLPKDMGEFNIESGNVNKVSVTSQGRPICTITYGRQYYVWRRGASGGIIAVRDGEVMRFRGEFALRPGITRAKVDIPPESPIYHLGLDHPAITLCGKDATAVLGVDLQAVGRLQ